MNPFDLAGTGAPEVVRLLTRTDRGRLSFDAPGGRVRMEAYPWDTPTGVRWVLTQGDVRAFGDAVDAVLEPFESIGGAWGQGLSVYVLSDSDTVAFLKCMASDVSNVYVEHGLRPCPAFKEAEASEWAQRAFLTLEAMAGRMEVADPEAFAVGDPRGDAVRSALEALDGLERAFKEAGQ